MIAKSSHSKFRRKVNHSKDMRWFSLEKHSNIAWSDLFDGHDYTGLGEKLFCLRYYGRGEGQAGGDKRAKEAADTYYEKPWPSDMTIEASEIILTPKVAFMTLNSEGGNKVPGGELKMHDRDPRIAGLLVVCGPVVLNWLRISKWVQLKRFSKRLRKSAGIKFWTVILLIKKWPKLTTLSVIRTHIDVYESPRVIIG